MGAVISLTTMAVAGRELSSTLSTFQILFVRSLIGLVVVGIIVLRQGVGTVRTQQPVLQIVRNIIHFSGQYCWFYGISLLPLGLVFALEFTSPIWVAGLATLFLGEKLTPARIAAVLLGFVGVLIILRPGLSDISPIAIIVLVAAASYGAAHVATKGITRTDSALSVLFYMTVVQLPLGLIPAIMHWVNPPIDLWPVLLLVGVMGLSAHYCMAQALRRLDASVAIPVDFLRVPLAAIVGYLFYHEAIDIWVFAGAAIILFSNLRALRAERVR